MDSQSIVRYTVRLRGLLWECTEEAVKDFLGNEDITHAKLVLMKNGRSTGEAVVEFANESAYLAALGKDKAQMGSRYVEVMRAHPTDMDRALGIKVEEATGPVSQDSLVVMMRGLPYSSLEDDVEAFFANKDLTPRAIHMIKDQAGRPTGFCYTEWATKEEQTNALAMNKEHIGSRYVELFESNIEELTEDVTNGRPVGRKRKMTWFNKNKKKKRAGPIAMTENTAYRSGNYRGALQEHLDRAGKCTNLTFGTSEESKDTSDNSHVFVSVCKVQKLDDREVPEGMDIGKEGTGHASTKKQALQFAALDLILKMGLVSAEEHQKIHGTPSSET